MATVTLLAFAGAAKAADHDYTLFDPTPAAKLRPLCTDRPAKSTGPCTVDPGRFQVESDLFNFTQDRSGGLTTDTYGVTNPTLKLGITRTFDLEVNLAPLIIADTLDRSTKARGEARGIGDLYVRAKLNLVGADGGAFALAVVPYVKAPTAGKALGNGAVEEGVLAPMSVALPGNLSLSLTPEFDWLLNASGTGRHASLVNLIGVSRPVGPITASVELWNDVDLDPTGQVTQYSFDLGAAWIPTGQPNLQFDGGVNFGLNAATPGVQVYLGVSRRF